MNELLSRMNPEQIIPLFAILMVFGTVMVMVVARHWSRVRRAEMEIALKQEMLTRGMSAAEIKQVLEPSAGGIRGSRGCRS